jgi:CubicO group peptidase (beta-lactamase class C family)
MCSASRLLLPVSLLVLTPSRCPGAEPEAPKPPKTFEVKAVDEYLAAQVKAKGFVGMSVAVMRDGKIVLARGYGKASLQGPPVGVDTMFAAGSITKQFTCACVLLLAEEGKLSISDPVAKYYPDLTRARDVTLHDLMAHTSGYPDFYPLDFIDRRMKKPIEVDALIKQYAGGELDFAPGTRWSYSNTGYMILGRVVEKVSGKPFGVFLKERVLTPLGLSDTAFEPKPGGKNTATGYTAFALGDAEPATPESDGWIYTAGGLFTTPSDLCKWDLALMDGKLLRPESLRVMTTVRKLSDGRQTDYGCGLRIGLRDGETIWQHGGAVSGYLAYNTAVPRKKSALVLMTNCEHLDAGGLYQELLTLFLKAESGEVTPVPKVKGPEAKEAALDLLHQLQSGDVKRDNLGEEFDLFLSKERVAANRERLKALGEPEKVEVQSLSERGGMEVAVVRFTFKGTTLRALMYRTPDGKVQQYLLSRR